MFSVASAAPGGGRSSEFSSFLALIRLPGFFFFGNKAVNSEQEPHLCPPPGFPGLTGGIWGWFFGVFFGMIAGEQVAQGVPAFQGG